jgi:hypothetical protein
MFHEPCRRPGAPGQRWNLRDKEKAGFVKKPALQISGYFSGVRV